MFWASPGSATLPSSRFQLRKFDVFIHLRFHEFQSFWWCVPDICEISVLGSDENFSSCIPSPDVWFTAAFLVHLWTWADTRSKNRHRNGICFAFLKKRLGSCFMFFVWNTSLTSLDVSAWSQLGAERPKQQWRRAQLWGLLRQCRSCNWPSSAAQDCSKATRILIKSDQNRMKSV